MSGLVASSIGATGIYLLGATSNEGMTAKGSYLLQWHMLQRLNGKGCEWYDLGGINAEENPGVYHFKKGLGGDEVIQMGRYDLHPNRLSEFAVGTAQRMRALVERLLTTAKAEFPRAPESTIRAVTELTIVIVNWNGGQLLMRCLDSIRASRCDAELDVIVVDNHSSDGSREAAAVAFPEFRVIDSGTNLGFGRATTSRPRSPTAPSCCSSIRTRN